MTHLWVSQMGGGVQQITHAVITVFNVFFTILGGINVTQTSFLWSVWSKKAHSVYGKSSGWIYKQQTKCIFPFWFIAEHGLSDRCSYSTIAQLTSRQALASKHTGGKSKQTLCAFQHPHKQRELQLLWNFHTGLYPLQKQPLSLFPNLNPHWAAGRSHAHKKKKMPLCHTRAYKQTLTGKKQPQSHKETPVGKREIAEELKKKSKSWFWWYTTLPNSFWGYDDSYWHRRFRTDVVKSHS